MFFDFLTYQKFKDPYKMSNINVVQSYWYFAQFNKIKNKKVAKIWGL